MQLRNPKNYTKTSVNKYLKHTNVSSWDFLSTTSVGTELNGRGFDFVLLYILDSTPNTALAFTLISLPNFLHNFDISSSEALISLY